MILYVGKKSDSVIPKCIVFSRLGKVLEIKEIAPTERDTVFQKYNPL